MKSILVLLVAVFAVASSEDISRILTPPNEDDADTSNTWQEHSKSSTTDASLKTTKDSYLPIDDSQSYSSIKIKSTTSRALLKKVGGGDKPSKLNPIPESDDDVENFEESAQSYYGRGFRGGYGGRYGYGYPSYRYGGYFRRPYYGPYGGYGYGR